MRVSSKATWIESRGLGAINLPATERRDPRGDG